MAAKRRRAKRKNPTKKRRHKRAAAPAVKRRRARRANPKRRVKRSHARRVRRANPKRHHAATRRRSSKRNPMRRRSPKRRSRRNPGIPMWAMAGLAAGLGLVTYAIGQAGSFALTQRTDPSRATLDRNRYLGFGVLTAAGLALAAMKSPLLGAGVAAGGLMGLAGTELSLALGRVLDKTTTPAALAGTYDPQIAAVFGGGNQRFAAVFDGGVQRLNGMGATFDDGRQQFAGCYDDYSEFGG